MLYSLMLKSTSPISAIMFPMLSGTILSGSIYVYRLFVQAIIADDTASKIPFWPLAGNHYLVWAKVHLHSVSLPKE